MKNLLILSIRIFFNYTVIKHDSVVTACYSLLLFLLIVYAIKSILQSDTFNCILSMFTAASAFGACRPSPLVTDSSMVSNDLMLTLIAFGRFSTPKLEPKPLQLLISGAFLPFNTVSYPIIVKSYGTSNVSNVISTATAGKDNNVVHPTVLNNINSKALIKRVLFYYPKTDLSQANVAIAKTYPINPYIIQTERDEQDNIDYSKDPFGSDSIYRDSTFRTYEFGNPADKARLMIDCRANPNGIYIWIDKDGNIDVVGESKSLAKRMEDYSILNKKNIKGKIYDTLKRNGVKSYTVQIIFLPLNLNTVERRLLETYLINTLMPRCNTFASSGLYADRGMLRQRASQGNYLHVYNANGTYLTTLFSLPECNEYLSTSAETLKKHMAKKQKNPALLFRDYLLLERNPLNSAPALFERNLNDPKLDQASLKAFSEFVRSKWDDSKPDASRVVLINMLTGRPSGATALRSKANELLFVFSSRKQAYNFFHIGSVRFNSILNVGHNNVLPLNLGVYDYTSAYKDTKPKYNNLNDLSRYIASLDA